MYKLFQHTYSPSYVMSVRYLRSKECFLVSRKEINPGRVRFYSKKMECDDECACECFSSFDDYLLLNHEVKKVELNDSNWQLSKCTCYTFFKKLICKHIVAVAVSKNLCQIDYGFQSIGVKKKPGRKKKAKSCWEKQAGDE